MDLIVEGGLQKAGEVYVHVHVHVHLYVHVHACVLDLIVEGGLQKANEAGDAVEAVDDVRIGRRA